ncbi:hypothetical protein [Nocardia tengchongensis]|uniref:hypothetical protein n=1 Tax=Nocardia tengchongensis TaxID=2055889 RepID=UPI0036A70619
MTTLTILAENYGAPIDLVAEMLGISMPRAYSLERRWREAGMVNQHRVRPVPGPHWVFPRRSIAEALLGFPVYRHWMPTAKMADHVATVLRVRLALVGMDLHRWTGERQLRAEVAPVKFGQKREHIHDGRYIDSEGRSWAVEVELTPKAPTYAFQALHGAVAQASQAECSGVIYYCRGEAVRKAVYAAGERIVKGHSGLLGDMQIQVIRLEKLLGDDPVTGGNKPGLRLIEGGTTATTA